MTDEELRVRAIQELEFYKKDDTFMLADITVDLAIKALEQMPVTTTAGEGGVIYYPQVEGVTPTVIDAGKQEPCGDAIDRSKAIMIASGYCHPANVAKELAKLPAVTPQPPTGYWIGIDGKPSHLQDGMTTGSAWCLECGKWLTASDEYSCFGKFCPNCGARMEDKE